MSDESSSTEAVAVENATDLHRYEISVDGELAGFTEYLDREQQRIFYHTEIDERFSGRGLASTLISQALTSSRSAGMRIVPVCPFVARYLKRHNEFDDITDPVTPAALAAVEAVREA